MSTFSSYLTRWLSQNFGSAIHQQLLCVGRLLSSKRVEQLTKTSQAPGASFAAGWFLVGEMPEAMMERTRNNEPMQTGFTVLSSTGKHKGIKGMNAVVLTQTIGNWQHRFTMPLLGESTLEWLEQACQSPVGVSLSTRGIPGEILGYADVTAYAASIEELEVTMKVDDPAALACDLVSLTHEALQPDRTVSTPNVTQVCVTLVLSDELRLALELASRQGRGAN